MKSLFKTNIVLILLFSGILFSCKDNKDGYSDQIETLENKTDSTELASDSVNVDANGIESNSTDQPNTGAESKTGTPTSTEDGNVPGSTSTGTSTTGSAASAGTGSGPGESVKDGATYTNTSDNKEAAAKKSKTSPKK